ncbi:hypothetical protein PIB30_069599 [Stylosanthes scabra]|uniref:Hydroxyproline-rich glycoprotein family protein n=1 Tax=Stylosanthes scabra TaxID=79078 RepID=A0ABU6YKU3_9FABA|nr:hypothetical protein [Stylosanthes scabra]
MENHDYSSPPHVHGGDASRPSLGFPLGTALLLIIIFSLSGIFSCCYHWDKLRSFRQSQSTPPSSSSSPSHSSSLSPIKPNLISTGMKQSKGESLPVLMPGDQIPKFIAMPCPCQPHHSENIIVTVQHPPPKPPRLPVPFY